MACVHAERKKRPGRQATVYGVVTDGDEWRFLRLNEAGKYSIHLERWAQGGPTAFRVATLLGFIMKQAMLLSPVASRLHSQEVSMEDDEPMKLLYE
ncbi:hypothetical protein N7454_005583 [Penicillium verhagenii]|nr:hypothetical protein N7454_005583 [Penicillium verhagenii]